MSHVRPGKLRAVLVDLPRWFVLPFVVSPIVLGIALTHTWSWRSGLVIAAGIILMVAAHIWNSVLDWTFGLDRPGDQDGDKLYTRHKAVLAKGVLSIKAMCIIALALTLLGGLLLLSMRGSSLLIGALLMALVVWYSMAKFCWHPEVPLALAFGPGLVGLGMSAAGPVDWARGFPASIPFMITFGLMGAWVDQYLDYKTDWPRGARSFGLLAAHRGWPLSVVLLPVLVLAYGSQVALVFAGILRPETLLSLIALFPLLYSLGAFAKGATRHGVLFGLLGLVAFHVLLTVGQVIGG